MPSACVLLVEEKAYYLNIEPDFIRKLAYAKKIKVEVLGSTDVLKRYFEEKNLSNMKEFYHHYTDTVEVYHDFSP